MKYAFTTIFFCLALFGCEKIQKEKIMSGSNMPISIRLHENGSDFSKKHQGLIKEDRQPAGLNFYEANWRSEQKGNVAIYFNRAILNIDNAIGFVATEDAEKIDEGILEITVNSGITGPYGQHHEKVRDKLFSIFGNIIKTGWTPLIPHALPRLNGKYMLDFALKSANPHGLDPTYVPTADEWLRIKDLTTWEFYSEDAFLQISFLREPKKSNPHKEGIYIIKYNIESKKDYYREFVAPDQKDNWSIQLPKELADAELRRAKLEKKLHSEGIPIITTYRNPPIPDF